MTPDVSSQKKKKKQKRKKKMSRGSLHTSAFNQRRLGSLDTPTSSHGNSGSGSARRGHELSPSFSSENRVRSLRQARKSLVETSPAHDTPRSRKQNEEADDFIECVSDRLTQGEDVIFFYEYTSNVYHWILYFFYMIILIMHAQQRLVVVMMMMMMMMR